MTASFEVKSLSILNEKGEADETLMPSLPDDDIKRIFELMVLSRTFDEAALSLQREGRIGTYASMLGQEASQIGSALAFEKSDWIFPSFREMAVYITMGYPMYMLLQYWSGDERGARAPAGLNIFPVCVPVGTQIPHAVGASMAAKYKGDKAVACCYFGDGGTSKGDFHEGLNMAGVFKLPVVFICQNNQWAISVPRRRQSASKTLSQKAYSYGFEGIQVDGNDVFAVYKATSEAVRKARGGGGPTLIECFTYRMSDHTTADDSSKYRSNEEVESWKPKDPLLRLKLFMEKKGLWNEQYQKGVEEKSKTAVEQAIRKAESLSPPEPADMFRYALKSPTPRQAKEMEDF
ncbi:MAG: pyruvate dehydrogenase (acetyl-transferring) E1 component subunit alpha [Thermodesulfovibrionales bacterium]|nr:pyruvate dehydrogenase (acetyl-transferring) E1 component subunit alpha [Thermodesulfovibrionales bacterium]